MRYSDKNCTKAFWVLYHDYGFVSDLMKHGTAGLDFKVSLLSLLNETKEQLKIPHFMKNVNIALLPKPGKKDLQDIKMCVAPTNGNLITF